MAKKSTIDLTASNRDQHEKQSQELLVKDLFLDPKNPRLAEVDYNSNQSSIQNALEKDFDIEPIAQSLYQNGFFWEEPLLAIKEKLKDGGKLPVYVVVEGNRRLAALKFIQSNPSVFPDKRKREDLEKVPVIVRTNREETLSFVGYRHITGIMPWDSAAMAQYALTIVKAGNTIEQVADLIGDKTKKIERLIRTQSIIERANENGLSKEDAAKSFFFSYLLTATDSIAAKEWLELKTSSQTGIVKSINQKNLSSLWSWLYGSKANEVAPVISESREISKLTKIIAKKDAVKELEKTRNIDKAFTFTKSREEYAAEVLSEARSLLQDLYSSIYQEGRLLGKDNNREHLDTSRKELEKINKNIDLLEPLIKE